MSKSQLSDCEMDQNCDSESMDAETSLKEIFIKEEILDIEDTDAVAAADSHLKRIPLVYTTRLDDMVILNSNISNLQPRRVTAIILEESKPKLQTFPNISHSRSSKKKYRATQNKLKELYHHQNIKLGTTDIELELSEAVTDVYSMKCEVHEEPIGATKSKHLEADPLIKCEVIDEPIRVCKYSELLKLCRPCSVVLSILDSQEQLKLFTSKAKIVEGNGISKDHQHSAVNIDSSSDEEPLITINSTLKSKSGSDESEVLHGVKTKTGSVKDYKPAYNLSLESDYQKKIIASFQKRLLVDGILEVTELYSNECNSYCYNRKGYLLAYCKGKDDVAKYKDSCNKRSYFPVKSCCWVQRDEIIQSLYPKALLYASVRFMRKPHTCPAGKCSCCCQKQQGIFEKPVMEVSDEVPGDHVPFLQEAKEIQALEKDIQKTIIIMQKEARKKRKQLRNLLKNRNAQMPVANKGAISLIDLALMYKKPLPKKRIDNRRLLSLKLDNSQSSVIILKNFTADKREIYELNPDGELKSYLKLTCFNNTDRPDVKKLMQKAKLVDDVCCWFKRENIINKLFKSKILHHSTIKYIRTRHICAGNECNCCCKPAEAKEVTLTSIKFPSRPSYWPELLNKMKAPTKKSNWLDNYVIRPAPSSVSVPVAVVSKPPVLPRLLPKLLPKITPVQTKDQTTKAQVIPQAAAGQLDNRYIKPASFYTATTSAKSTTEEDCQFMGIRVAPTLGFEGNSAPSGQPNNITNVEGDVLTNEVNSLITSILDRFKDVRLTINSDGKVAAALNTPVSNLTTVELKVLANILSYAQSQINSLGLNSGISLSNIINLKVGNPQTATSIDPTSAYEAFGENVNFKNLSSGTNVNIVNPSKTAAANIIGESSILLDASTPNKHDMNDYFTKTMCMKNKQYTDSFTSLLSPKLEAEQSNVSVPVIQNVFSLHDQNINTGVETSSATVFCRNPANQNKRPTVSKEDTIKVYANNSKKRASITNTELTPVSKKIRVLSPSKLCAGPIDKLHTLINSVNEVSLPATNTHAINVDGIRIGVPLLSNKKINVLKIIPQVELPRVTKPRIIREHNFKAFVPQPSIVSTPQINNSNDEIGDEPSIIGTPFSAASVGSTTENIEMLEEVPIKIEQDVHQEDDCILGV